MTSWIEAVAKWRAGGGKGSIPSKGSADYLKIKAMMGKSTAKGAVKEGYEKIVRPTKKGAARVGGKGNAKFMKTMEEEFFTEKKAPAKKMTVKKMTVKEKKTKAVADMAKDVGFEEFKETKKSRKVRSDKGKKRVKKE
jgi:hypothetical protein